MANKPLQALIRHLRRILDPKGGGGLTDAQLLERFVTERDEAAFEVLLWRHGPMVLSVCRRLLRHEHDAEDAFQATFFTLVRKAAAIGNRNAVGSWLYKVAYRIALDARAQARKRAAQEKPIGILPAPAVSSDLIWKDLRPVLDEEISRLPEKYRVPFVLCYLEGKTNEEAARELNCPKGTVVSRLAWARERLRTRLSRRGLTLSAGLFASALAQSAASAAIPAALVMSTAKAAQLVAAGKAAAVAGVSAQAAALAEGALQAMFLTKVKIAALVLTAGFVIAGTGVLTHRGLAEKQAVTQLQEMPKPTARVVKEAGKPIPKEELPARKDLFGDPLPPGASARMGTVRLRHWSIGGHNHAFSPDGKTLATGGNTIHLWDTTTGKLLLKIKEGSEYGPFLFSPDGKWLAVVYSEAGRSVGLLNPTTGQVVHRLPVEVVKEGQPISIGNIAFSPDSKLLAGGSADGTVYLWSTVTGQRLKRLRDGHREMFPRVRFTSDGATLVSLGGQAKKICHWDVASGQLRDTVQLAMGKFYASRISDDGRTVAGSCFPEWEVRLWDTTTGQERCLLHDEQASRGGRPSMGFTPDGKTLAITRGDEWSDEGTVSLWDTCTGKRLRSFPIPVEAAHTVYLGISPDGRTLVTPLYGTAYILWDTRTGKRLHQAPTHEAVPSMVFTPDGRTLISGSRDGTIRLWETATGRHLRELPGSQNPVHSIALLPDGKTVIACERHALRLQDLETGRVLRRFVVDEKGSEEKKVLYFNFEAETFALAEDGRTVALKSQGAKGFRVQVWAPATGKELARRASPVFSGDVFSPDLTVSAGFLVLGPDGPIQKRLQLKGSGEKPIKTTQTVVLEVTTGRRLFTIPASEEDHRAWAFSPNGQTLVTVTEDLSGQEDSRRGGRNTLHFWELASGKEWQALPLNRRCNWLAFAPNGRTMAVAFYDDKTIELRDVATGEELLRRGGFESPVSSLVFSPDSRVLASAHADCSILIWNLSPAARRMNKPSRKITTQELEARWNDLAGPDARKAYSAIWALASVPKQSIAVIHDRLQPAPPIPADKVKQLLADLDSEKFQLRQQALLELRDLGEQVEPALAEALKARPALEKRRRIEQLLTGPRRELSAQELRQLRSIEVLEHADTAEAQQVLKTLAQGAPEARLTKNAQAALERLKKRPAR